MSENLNVFNSMVNFLENFISGRQSHLPNINDTINETIMDNEFISDIIHDCNIIISDDENNDENEVVEVTRYVLQGYDNTSNKNIIRWVVYFVKEYNIEIKIRIYAPYLSRSYVDPIEINEAKNPVNKYQMKYMGELFESKIETVKISKKWINSCVEIYKTNKTLLELKNKAFFTAPLVKTPLDIMKEEFEKGLKCFEFHNNFQIGRKHFLKSLEVAKEYKYTQYLDLCYYNISCCYSRENDIKDAINWLNMAIENGYNNWEYVITDHNMFPLLENDNFIELIKNIIKKNPKRSQNNGVITEINKIDLFLKKHNISLI